MQRIRSAKLLRCGIITEEAEYSTSDDHGSREALDIDLCRAVAVAVLNDAEHISVTRYPDDHTSMQALARSEVDLIVTLTDDFTHQAGTHIAFTRPVLWDGVGFLLPAGSNVENARQLSGKKICFLAETTVEESMRAWFNTTHLDFVPFPYQEEGEMEAAFATGNCGALAGDQTRLAQTRALFAKHGRPTRLLLDKISEDPLAMAVRDDDAQWLFITEWVIEALMAAEEHGVTKANVDVMQNKYAQAASPDEALRFLLGGSHEIGSTIGLRDDWVVRVIHTTGNYGEIYDRDLGVKSPLQIPREKNELQKNGGVMLALPTK